MPRVGGTGAMRPGTAVLAQVAGNAVDDVTLASIVAALTGHGPRLHRNNVLARLIRGTRRDRLKRAKELQLRFAREKIDRDTFLAMRRDLWAGYRFTDGPDAWARTEWIRGSYE